MLSFTIREATKEDIPLIVPIWMHNQSIINKGEPLSSREHYEQFFLALFHLIKTSPNHNFWVAEENTTENKGNKEEKPNILGWVAISPYCSNPLRFTQTGLASIYISPAYKNMGIGKKLMEVMTTWVKEHLRWLIVEVRIGNTLSEHLCTSNGFQSSGKVSPYMRIWHLLGTAKL
jgi:L-amino acid N-acyltransferase YncA